MGSHILPAGLIREGIGSRTSERLEDAPSVIRERVHRILERLVEPSRVRINELRILLHAVDLQTEERLFLRGVSGTNTCCRE